MRDHGGDIDRARSLYGGSDWIDLSTGINRVPYPLPALPDGAWTGLPTRAAMTDLLDIVRNAYGTTAPLLALAGAQAAIQLIPRLAMPGRARVLGPTYNEHAAALRRAGWDVREVTEPGDLAGAELAVVVNPNNPDGRAHETASLLALAGRVGRLVIDESFGDARPDGSLMPVAGREGLLVLRSFGKFYGLAGVRLGFVAGSGADIEALSELAGPWSVSGPAIAIGRAALADRDWARATAARLRADATRLDALAEAAGWTTRGGTELFRLYATPDATQAQARLARRQIWSRTFPYSQHWLRLGLPGDRREWDRVASAL